jgi:hypothetical protein
LLDQLSIRLRAAPPAIAGVWTFCRSFQRALLAKFNLADSLRSGMATSASRMPAHRAIAQFKNILREPEKAFLLSNNVKTKGDISTTKLRTVLFTWRLRFFVKFARSAPAKLITTKPAHRAKKDWAALLFSKTVTASGLKIKMASAISGTR